MKNVLVLEDDMEMLNLIEKLIGEIRGSFHVYKVSSVAEAYRTAIEKNISLFVVDIMLDSSVRDDVSGLKFVEKLRTIDKYRFVPVIFITALSDPELHAYRNLHCYGYLEKPLIIREAKRLMEEALQYEYQDEGDSVLYLRKDGVIYAIREKDIIYIRSHAGKVTIKAIKEELMVYYRNCKDILEKLDSKAFIPCNRSTMVNRNYIKSVDTTNRIIQLKENYGMIEIGVTMKKKFMELLSND